MVIVERIIPKSKRCTKCGITKPSEEFPRKSAYRDGLSSWCKQCNYISSRNAIEKRADYYRERIKEYNKKYMVGYKSPNKSENDRKYREKHKDALREKARVRKIERRKVDVKYLLDDRIRHSIWKALRENKGRRRWESLVGYTLDDLHKHLSKTIPEGYSWNDYLNGILQIDHIIPRCAFNYEKHTDLDFKRCWSLGNLRLLTKEENYEKRGRISGEHQPSLLI